jgi:hypothetical protein
MVLERLTTVPIIMRKDFCPIPSVKLLEEPSLLEERKEEVNCDEIWKLQYEA